MVRATSAVLEILTEVFRCRSRRDVKLAIHTYNPAHAMGALVPERDAPRPTRS